MSCFVMLFKFLKSTQTRKDPLFPEQILFVRAILSGQVCWPLMTVFCQSLFFQNLGPLGPPGGVQNGLVDCSQVLPQCNVWHCSSILGVCVTCTGIRWACARSFCGIPHILQTIRLRLSNSVWAFYRHFILLLCDMISACLCQLMVCNAPWLPCSVQTLRG